jgi:hypothetical protein
MGGGKSPQASAQQSAADQTALYQQNFNQQAAYNAQIEDQQKQAAQALYAMLTGSGSPQAQSASSSAAPNQQLGQKIGQDGTIGVPLPTPPGQSFPLFGRQLGNSQSLAQTPPPRP